MQAQCPALGSQQPCLHGGLLPALLLPTSVHHTPATPQPYEFVVGEPVLGMSVRKAEADAGNGLFTGQSGPKPPQALSNAVLGMRKGGKVREGRPGFVTGVHSHVSAPGHGPRVHSRCHKS